MADKPTTPTADSPEPAWLGQLAQLVAKRRYAAALSLLDRIVSVEAPLFAELPEEVASRRLAWLCRIDLLRERGRLAEALAWTCLECEMSPENVAAQALKERLKHALFLSRQRPLESRARVVAGRWEGVAGMRELKAILERDVLLPLQEPELYRRYKVDLPNGVLLYGPPGCGKTFIARALATRLGYNFVEVKPSDLASIFVHGSQEKIGKLFSEAARNAPTLLFLDEIDALVPARFGVEALNHSFAGEVNEFLVQLNECSQRRTLVIGATNNIRGIDRAILRPGRMDKKIFVGPPDLEARVEALRHSVHGRPHGKIDWLAVAEATRDYSFAELEHVVNESARSALAERRNIETWDLLTAATANPPQPKEKAEAEPTG